MHNLASTAEILNNCLLEEQTRLSESRKRATPIGSFPADDRRPAAKGRASSIFWASGCRSHRLRKGLAHPRAQRAQEEGSEKER